MEPDNTTQNRYLYLDAISVNRFAWALASGPVGSVNEIQKEIWIPTEVSQQGWDLDRKDIGELVLICTCEYGQNFQVVAWTADSGTSSSKSKYSLLILNSLLGAYSKTLAVAATTASKGWGYAWVLGRWGRTSSKVQCRIAELCNSVLHSSLEANEIRPFLWKI